jgi:hypothetical protein
MSRRVTESCLQCGATWTQDWEEPPECPYCGDEPYCQRCGVHVDDCDCADGPDCDLLTEDEIDEIRARNTRVSGGTP